MPALRFWPARMLVRRSTSASIHSFITASRATASRRSAGSSRQTCMSSPIGPDSRAATAPPMVTRSFMSVVIDTRQPSPTSPTRSASGTRTSVM